MNQRELNELRRRFKPDRTAISKVYGCYVSSSRQIISYVDAPLGLLSQEEQEMYLNLLKKSLSGALGRNLIDRSKKHSGFIVSSYSFSTIKTR